MDEQFPGAAFRTGLVQLMRAGISARARIRGVSPVRELNDRDLARILRNYELGLRVLVPGGLPAALHEQFSDLRDQRKLGLARGG
jgi:hypothetical protein